MVTYLTVFAILLASSVIQGAVGFAGGLFAIPLLMLTGHSLPEAVSINVIASTVQNALGMWRLRREIVFREVWRPTLLRLFALPLGVTTLYFLGTASKDTASQLVGCVILAILAVQWLLSVPPQDKLHWGWELGAFSCAGFFVGLCGMGGPFMVLWVMAHRWPTARAKAFLYFSFFTVMIPQTLLMWLFFGTDVLQAFGLGLLGIPALIIGMLLGLWIASHLPDHVVRRLTFGVLVIIAVSSIVTPFVRSIRTRVQRVPQPVSEAVEAEHRQ